MKRLLYYSQIRCDSESEFRRTVNADMESLRRDWAVQGLSDVSIFVSQLYVFIYAESAHLSEQAEWRWPQHYSRWLESWPANPLSKAEIEATARLEVPLIDIYHDGVPSDYDTWRKNRQIDERIGSIACLRPEMAASYIYYHFQRQEEAEPSFNETYMIGLFGTLIFSYHELPSLVSEHTRQGLLNTQQTPSNWHEVMQPHFIPWTDEAGRDFPWMRMERINGSL
ncbi:hypothetical protein MUG84_08575 [Paenibacillus sp. KQZ6P-2]|uniref:Uncharacterized protein n=1 Tax=Paenibacillus mangrovi TaxID=2931978 RepID=A0A9X1WR09_9BACL|nr:hypothetical protein [Paenibacillus mangrovi]MCJ8011795.1 hypothetical protein [Paenibacillus mangrovi]